VIRMAVAHAGDGQDDPNIDFAFAESAQDRLREWLRFAARPHPTRKDRRSMDGWFLSTLNRSVRAAREAMEGMNYKTALRVGYFDLQSAWSWYVRRSGGRPNGEVLDRFIDTQTRLLAPFAPHVCEEIWARRKGTGFVSNAAYPVPVESEVDVGAEAGEALLQRTLADVREILKVTGLKPERIALYTAPDWKVRMRLAAREMARSGGVAMHRLMETSLGVPGMRERAKEAAAYAKRLLEEFRHVRPEDLPGASEGQEFDRFSENASFLRGELGIRVDVFRADDPARWDPAGRAEHAVPGRPAIYVE